MTEATSAFLHMDSRDRPDGKLDLAITGTTWTFADGTKTYEAEAPETVIGVFEKKSPLRRLWHRLFH